MKHLRWLALMALFVTVPLHAAEVCVYGASGYLATGTQNCVKNSSHGGASEGYTTIDCTGAQVAVFDSYIPTGPGSTFTATAYVYSDDTGAGKVCLASVGVMSMVGHCLTPAGATTNDGAVCQTSSDCTGGRTCIGGVLDDASLIVSVVNTSATRTFATNTRYVTTASSAGNLQRWGDDGASAWGAGNVNCGAGSCTGHAAKVYAILNGTGTTASDCQWYAICVETP